MITDFDNKVLNAMPYSDSCGDQGVTACMLRCEVGSTTRKISNSLYKLKRHGLVKTYIGRKNNRDVRKFEKVR